jgi:Homeodomain-like domain
MSRGFQPNPIAEHAALTEISVAVTEWQRAEAEAKQLARSAIDSGVRAQVIADHLGWHRSTLHRWLAG